MAPPLLSVPRHLILPATRYTTTHEVPPNLEKMGRCVAIPCCGSLTLESRLCRDRELGIRALCILPISHSGFAIAWLRLRLGYPSCVEMLTASVLRVSQC